MKLETNIKGNVYQAKSIKSLRHILISKVGGGIEIKSVTKDKSEYAIIRCNSVIGYAQDKEKVR